MIGGCICIFENILFLISCGVCSGRGGCYNINWLLPQDDSAGYTVDSGRAQLRAEYEDSLPHSPPLSPPLPHRVKDPSPRRQ